MQGTVTVQILLHKHQAFLASVIVYIDFCSGVMITTSHQDAQPFSSRVDAPAQAKPVRGQTPRGFYVIKSHVIKALAGHNGHCKNSAMMNMLFTVGEILDRCGNDPSAGSPISQK